MTYTKGNGKYIYKFAVLWRVECLLQTAWALSSGFDRRGAVARLGLGLSVNNRSAGRL